MWKELMDLGEFLILAAIYFVVFAGMTICAAIIFSLGGL